MKKLKLLILSFIFLLIPVISLGVTGHINGCTNTTFDTNCCTKTFKITAQSGYTVTDVIVNGVSQGAISSYTFSNISGPQTLKVVTTANGGSTSGGSTGGGTTEGSGTVSSTNSDCVVLIPYDSGTTVKMNGTALSVGQHIIPYGTVLEFIVTVEAHNDYYIFINGTQVFFREDTNGDHDISYSYTVVGDMSYYLDGQDLYINTNRCNGLSSGSGATKVELVHTTKSNPLYVLNHPSSMTGWPE